MQPEKTRRHKGKDLIIAISHKYGDRNIKNTWRIPSE